MSDARFLKNIFVNTRTFLVAYAGNIRADVVTYLRKVKKRFTDKDEFFNYLSTDGTKLVFVTIYVIVNVVLFLEAAIRWGLFIESALGVQSFWIGIARGFGQLLNFNSALLLIPVMRSTLSLLRNFKVFRYIIPLDKNIIFHRYIAYNLVFFSLGHGLAHYFNYSCCSYMYLGNAPNSPDNGWWKTSFATKSGITGNLLFLIMVILYGASNKSYRKSENFNVFWYTHHLFLPFFILLILHCKNFWLWFLGPGAFYLFERLLRNIRGSENHLLVSCHSLASRVIELKLLQPGFNYHAGQFVYLNVPEISVQEWHPFTISSSPEEQYMTFHIRIVGDWTAALEQLLNPSRAPSVKFNPQDAHSTGLIRIDGPFGTCAENIMDYDNVWMIGAGIGVTPYAALLKQLFYLKKRYKLKKIEHVTFYWVNRDEGSFEWFCELLNDLEQKEPEFFDICTFMTGQLSADKIRAIIESSEEVQAKAGGLPKSSSVIARALSDFESNTSDELQITTGDIISVQDQSDDDWWLGINTRTNLRGYFPKSHVFLVDNITGLKNNKKRKFGRPVWEDEFFSQEQKAMNNKKTSCGIFFCGPAALSKQLKKMSAQFSSKGNVRFSFHKELF